MVYGEKFRKRDLERFIVLQVSENQSRENPVVFPMKERKKQDHTLNAQPLPEKFSWPRYLAIGTAMMDSHNRPAYP